MAPETPEPDAFCASREHFEAVIGYLRGPDALRLEHAELEARLAADMREVIRQLYQDHLDLRAKNEERLCDGVAAGGTPYRAVEADHGDGHVLVGRRGILQRPRIGGVSAGCEADQSRSRAGQ
jgi:hypothetical protein